MALLSDFVRSYCRFQSIISRRPASAYAVSHLLLRSVPVPGDQVRIGARGISRVTAGGRAGGRIGILFVGVAGYQFDKITSDGC